MKKLFAMMLAAAMCLSLCVPAFAAENMTNEEIVKGAIDVFERQRIHEQLEDQGAADAAHAHEYIYRTTTVNSALRGSEDEYTNVYAQYGGTLEYRTRVDGVRTDVAITHLDFENSYYYVLSQSQVGVGDVIFSILGYFPLVGPLASSIANINTLVTSSACTSIQNANGFAKITVSQDYNGTSTTVSGWTTHSNIYLYDPLATNIVVTLFPETHPFG
ncbi:MAG: hypothetical protein PUC93_04555 [Oscillospiraceae bacterium]|nr:hypothetical protein [Oscillospiraceae bacterium]